MTGGTGSPAPRPAAGVSAAAVEYQRAVVLLAKDRAKAAASLRACLGHDPLFNKGNQEPTADINHACQQVRDWQRYIATTHSPYLRDAVPPDAVYDLGDLGDGTKAGGA